MYKILKLRDLCRGIVFVMIFFIIGCGPANEKAHPLFRKAEHCVNNGEYQEAVANFEKYLKINPDSSRTHYKLAELYLDNLDDPFYAVYHFREFLKLNPNSPDRDLIQTWIDAGERKMVERITERDPSAVSREEVEKLKEYNAKYREYLIELKKQNAEMRRKLSGSVILRTRKHDISDSRERDVSNAEGDQSEIFLPVDKNQNILKIYTVKQGDNLSKISREVYGSANYYRQIFEANRDTMLTEASLKIGQELRIPQLKK